MTDLVCCNLLRKQCLRRLFWVVFVMASAYTTPHVAEEPNAAKESSDGPTFDADVRPILQRSCFKCHGEKRQKAELDLRTAETITQGGESGTIVVPGKPDESPLYEVVHEGAMPPGKKNRLSERDVETIRDWILGGAQFGSNNAAPVQRVNQHDVIPVMLLRCTVCHGKSRREGGLDLRTKESMLEGGKSGPAFVPGRPEESLMLKRLHAGEMPPRRQVVSVGVKPMEDGEIELLTQWIGLGAPTMPSSPPRESQFNESEQSFWAFRPVRDVEVPNVQGTKRVRNSVDAFVLAALESEGLSLAPEADKITLLRRAYFDLLGLPPPPEEVARFVNDTNPEAYEKLVDRLLASSDYGERWGRHWLDVSGYADSEGKREQDLSRLHAYRYRDYVIRAFGADKPYDRFLTEQLAGDELYDYESAPKITPEIYDALVATGFLRMGPDGTWAAITNFVPDRLEVIADALDVIGSGLMGLTFKCARCHSHKFDPIPQRDYYRLSAIFKGAYDEHSWLRPGKAAQYPFRARKFATRTLPHVLPEELEAWKTHNQPIEAELAELAKQFGADESRAREARVTARLKELPEELHEDLQKLLATKAEDRDEVQRYLATKFEKSLTFDLSALKKADEEFNKRSKDYDRKKTELDEKLLPEPQIRALWDRGAPSPTYLLQRGNYLTSGSLVAPGFPSILTATGSKFEPTPPWPGSTKTGRRLALARWLVQPEHPLTARVITNRVWRNHFGRGLVKTLGNFGRLGARPTHPKLLDYLAAEFMRSGWSFKTIHRLLMTSSTYRQSSAVTAAHEQLDPDGSLYSRMPLRRLDAEELRDSILLAAGRLDRTRYGRPDRVEERDDGSVMEKGTNRGWRRSVYVEQRRKQPLTLFESFDLPVMNPNCLERQNSNVAPQALYLLNNGRVRRLAAAFAERVLTAAGEEPAAQVQHAYLIALSRYPSDHESRVSVEALSKLRAEWQRATESSVSSAEPGNEPTNDTQNPTLLALQDLCHTLINSAAFLYVD